MLQRIYQLSNEIEGSIFLFGAFAEDYPASRRVIVSLDPFNRRMGDIECIYVLDFFRMMWNNEF